MWSFKPDFSFHFVMERAEYIYVLHLQDGRYYVGQTNDVGRRWIEHTNGTGSAWTIQHAPRCIIDIRLKASVYDEDNVTKEYMNRYGIEFVRGGSYSSVHLSAEQKTLLSTELRTAFNRCYRCGRLDHYSNDCLLIADVPASTTTNSASSVAPQEFGLLNTVVRRAVNATRPFARAIADALLQPSLPVDKFKASSRSRGKKASNRYDNHAETDDRCFRCGRRGHYITDCYATVDFHGTYLPKCIDKTGLGNVHFQ